MLISNQGTPVRTRVSEISQMGRNTQGVTLIRLPEEEKLVGVVRIENLGDEDSVDANGEADVAADGVIVADGSNPEGASTQV